MDLGPQEIVLLSDVVHEQLERARRRMKKTKKRDRLAQNVLIDQLGRMQQRLDEERMLEVDMMATGLIGRMRERGGDPLEGIPEPVPPPTVE